MVATTLTSQLSHEPFPEMANALRARIQQTLKEWRTLAMEALPHLDDLRVAEFENSIGKILAAVADSLESDAAFEVRTLLKIAPEHGLDRYLQKYPLTDLLTENRILRGVIPVELEEELGRPLRTNEAASLHAAMDVMFHSGVQEMVDAQQEKLREAVESERKFLSFFSHDLNNNLFVVLARLDAIEKKISDLPQLAESVEMLQATRTTIRHTREGMHRLLQHEQLRSTKRDVQQQSVNMREAVELIVKPLSDIGQINDVRFEVDIDPSIEIETNAELLTLVLQNIINNAAKHCRCGLVRITGGCTENQQCRISVADEGQGIAKEKLAKIFEAFDRGSSPGTEGVGLGLAIASQAARMLGAQIEVESEIGKGTTFHVLLPSSRTSQETAGNRQRG